MKLCDARLDIRRMRPAQLPPLITGDVESSLLLVRCLPEDSGSPKDLACYLEREAPVGVQRIVYSMEAGVAMIEFKDEFG